MVHTTSPRSTTGCLKNWTAIWPVYKCSCTVFTELAYILWRALWCLFFLPSHWLAALTKSKSVALGGPLMRIKLASVSVFMWFLSSVLVIFKNPEMYNISLVTHSDRAHNCNQGVASATTLLTLLSFGDQSFYTLSDLPSPTKCYSTEVWKIFSECALCDESILQISGNLDVFSWCYAFFNKWAKMTKLASRNTLTAYELIIWCTVCFWHEFHALFQSPTWIWCCQAGLAVVTVGNWLTGCHSHPAWVSSNHRASLQRASSVLAGTPLTE